MAEIKNLLKQSSTFPVWLRSRHFMAGTLCLADVQLTAFQAYKKLIRLKIEFVTINCQEHCQHFQPRSASCTTTSRSACRGEQGWGGRGCAGPVLGRKGNWGKFTNGLWRHGRGLAWLVLGKVVEDSHRWVELCPPALGFETCKPHPWWPHGGNLHLQPAYIQRFINSLAELPDYNTERSACSRPSYKSQGREAAGKS